MYILTEQNVEYYVNKKCKSKTTLKNINFYFFTKTMDCAKILPKEMFDRFLKESFIAGGSVWGVLNNNTFDDFDFFIETEEFANQIKEYFNKKLPEILGIQLDNNELNGKLHFHDEKFKYIVTKNAVTIITPKDKFQIIYKWFGKPSNILATFDFYHCMIGYIKGKIKTLPSVEDIFSDLLIYNSSTTKCVTGSLKRIAKYNERGMKIDQYNMRKILSKLDQHGITEEDKEFLSGIDY